LVDKLHAQIPQICERKEVTPQLNIAVEALEELGSYKVSNGDMKEAKAHVNMFISKLIKKLKYLTCDEQQVAKELVSMPHVIFSTLTSAGATFVKKGITNVGAIIIDEAAAATEPQLYIPLVHMERKWLMVVGDPNQLPATVMSQGAERHGLNKSLHERLMFDCNRPYSTPCSMKQISRTVLHHPGNLLKVTLYFGIKTAKVLIK
jgi:AAA domain